MYIPISTYKNFPIEASTGIILTDGPKGTGTKVPDLFKDILTGLGTYVCG